MFGFFVFLLSIMIVIVFWKQKKALGRLKKDIAQLTTRIKSLEDQRGSSKPASEQPAETVKATESSKQVKPAESKPEPVAATKQPEKTMAAKEQKPQPVKQVKPATPDAVDLFLAKAGKWLFGGNLIMKVGGLVLFIGIGFFIKYMAPYFSMPLELRLAVAALVGLVILDLGWKLRKGKKEAALVLQGVGFGVVYLTLFAASGLFHLMSPIMAIVFMNLIILLAVVMAILQQAPALAFMAILGGFLAPVIIESENPSSLMLFVYYLSLNIGVALIRWFKKWESLELTAFLFTFTITALWYWNGYQAQDFWMTQIFLLVYFFLFIMMQLMHLKHRATAPGGLAKYLVYALPLVVCSIQLHMLAKSAYAGAFATLGFGSFYILIAAFLWRTRQQVARWIVSHYLIVGSIVVTTGIAFAFDGQASNLIWLLEGAALVVMGVKEKRLLPRLAGYGLQLYGGLALLGSVLHRYDEIIFLNQQFVSSVIVAIAGMVTIYYGSKHKTLLTKFEAKFVNPVMYTWAFLWWYSTGVLEILRLDFSPITLFSLSVLFVALSEGIAAWIAKKLDWQGIHSLSVIFPVLRLLLLFAMPLFYHATYANLFLVSAIWMAVLGMQYYVLRVSESFWQEKRLRYTHLVNYWMTISTITILLHLGVGQILSFRGNWANMMMGLVPGLWIYLQMKKEKQLTFWPCKRFESLYHSAATIPVMVYVGFWIAVSSFGYLPAWPVHYWPLVNNGELTQLFALLVLFQWLWHNRKLGRPFFVGDLGRVGWYGFSLLSVLFVTTVIGRSVHVFNGVPLDPFVLSDAMVFQSWISVIWTLIALSIMVIANRRKHREAWFGGAVFLGIVILKLFLVDLSKTDAIMRIVSFVGVGLLTLLLGYLSPLPPHKKERVEHEDQ